MEDELKGFQSEISDSGVALADTVVGPYTQEEFDIAYSRWQVLGIDVVCVSNYYSLNSDLVRMLRLKGSDIQVVSDYVMDTDYDIEQNGEYLDGTVIVPLYLTDDTAENDIKERYNEKYGFEMTEQDPKKDTTACTERSHTMKTERLSPPEIIFLNFQTARSAADNKGE